LGAIEHVQSRNHLFETEVSRSWREAARQARRNLIVEEYRRRSEDRDAIPLQSPARVPQSEMVSQGSGGVEEDALERSQVQCRLVAVLGRATSEVSEYEHSLVTRYLPRPQVEAIDVVRGIQALTIERPQPVEIDSFSRLGVKAVEPRDLLPTLLGLRKTEVLGSLGIGEPGQGEAVCLQLLRESRRERVAEVFEIFAVVDRNQQFDRMDSPGDTHFIGSSRELFQRLKDLIGRGNTTEQRSAILQVESLDVSQSDDRRSMDRRTIGSVEATDMGRDSDGTAKRI
jgi:hypothetical protein